MNDDQKPTAAESTGTDYKHTLNLPQTDFPMQASLAAREPKMLEQWEASQLYAQVMAATTPKTKDDEFWFVDGPPYANGDIHIGHAVNKVLKDIVVKSARLDGKSAAFIPGWDCHGLPIELQVEKKFGKVGEMNKSTADRAVMDAAAFRAECRKYAHEQIDRQRADFKRLGILADWDKPYLTMQPAFEAEQLRVLARIVDNGHVVRGFKPVHWCLDCGSSLAEAEVEYQDKQSFAIDVGFVADDPAVLAQVFGASGAEPIRYVIWTTTPWTLPANKAIAAHPELDYVLADFGTASGRLVLAEGLLDACAKRWGVESPRVLGRAKGASLEGRLAHRPLAKAGADAARLILGDYVTLDAGTGLVHTAPAHGLDDYLAGKRYGLPPESPLQSDGKYAADTPVVGGLHIRKVDEPILAALRETGALIHEAKITHSYPHCWRHKTPLIFRATPQWFVSMDSVDGVDLRQQPGNGWLCRSVRGKAITSLEQVDFIPNWGYDRLAGMVTDRPDWCISRQRTWGVPLALFVHKSTQEKHPRSGELLRAVADQVEKDGLEAWFGSSVADWLDAGEADDYERCTDTLDVWFDSGSVHQCSFVSTGVIGTGELAPRADFYLEGSDQHRGWFQSSLLTSVAMRGTSPYRNVLTHGFTVDEQGRKMSKSLGNVVAPQAVTKSLGADVLRLWVSSADYSGEIAISDNLLKRIADAYRRIRNTVRFLLGNLHGFDPETDAVPVEQMVAVDRWALSQAAARQDEIRAAYKDSQFHAVYQALHNYCVVDLGGLYLDILKDRLYTLPPKSLARRSAQTAMWHIAEALTRWIAPILSFTADEIWPLLPGKRERSVFAQRWYDFGLRHVPHRLNKDRWNDLVELRQAVNVEIEALRAQRKVGSGLEAKIVIAATVGLPVSETLTEIGEELRFWLLTSEATFVLEEDFDERLFEGFGEAVSVEISESQPVRIFVAPSTDPKCTRCWHRRPDVGQHAAHPLLCGRCVTNVEAIEQGGDGEQRRFI